jgi:thymidine kinase
MRLAPPTGGYVEVCCGPMMSGKSSELIRRVRLAQIAGKRVVVCRPRIDDRYAADAVATHTGETMQAVLVDDVGDILSASEGAEVVGIDEAQFLTEELVPLTRRLADAGVRVVVAGLDQDFRGEVFGPMGRLLATAEFVDKYQAVCQVCKGPATMTQRLIDGEPAPPDSPIVLVGAAEAYQARCRGCHRIG